MNFDEIFFHFKLFVKRKVKRTRLSSLLYTFFHSLSQNLSNMNRRYSLSLLVGQQKKKSTRPKKTNSSFITGGTFTKYAGEWGFEQAAHLLRRTTFGPRYSEIKQAVDDGLESTMSLLFQDQAMPDPPIYYDFENDPNAGLGETWIDADYLDGIQGLRGARRRSLFSWSYQQMNNSGVNITEKMTLFWHNHFVIAANNNVRRVYDYISFLRKNALGNFKELAKGITINPAMLQYLNGTQNSKRSPNENYSRELLELFTIGKGELAGPGDYTNYTEDDVVALARALTGWIHLNRDDRQAIAPVFVPNRHDTGEKQLSHRFNNIVISDGGAEEYKTVIDIIFQQDEVARFISRKLYRWFVHFDINSEVEANIIEPMSQILIADNYNIKAALMALLSSEHFYDTSIRACMITHPIDYLFKMIRSFDLQLPDNLYLEYGIFARFFQALRPLEMILFFHPNVAGWKAFYQAPQYYKTWISSVTLPFRMKLSDKFVNGFKIKGFLVQLNVLAFAAALDNPNDPNDLINEMASILFAHTLSEQQVTALKDILIPGLPDFEWTVEYVKYLEGATDLEAAIEKKLQQLVKAMLKMPEFYLI